jgi:hypothetical protein
MLPQDILGIWGFNPRYWQNWQKIGKCALPWITQVFGQKLSENMVSAEISRPRGINTPGYNHPRVKTPQGQNTPGSKHPRIKTPRDVPDPVLSINRLHATTVFQPRQVTKINKCANIANCNGVASTLFPVKQNFVAKQSFLYQNTY